MTFIAAVVSFLQSTGAGERQSMPMLKIHEAQQFVDKQAALTSMKVIAQSYLESTYRDLYAGVMTAECLETELPKYPPRCVGLTMGSDTVTVWCRGAQQKSGWISVAPVPAVVPLGYFTLLGFDKSVIEYDYRALQVEVAELRYYLSTAKLILDRHDELFQKYEESNERTTAKLKKYKTALLRERSRLSVLGAEFAEFRSQFASEIDEIEDLPLDDSTGGVVHVHLRDNSSSSDAPIVKCRTRSLPAPISKHGVCPSSEDASGENGSS
jgi:hypothetical protein